MPIIALAIGAGAGILKSEVVDKPKEERQRKLAAATQRLNPWTGLKANPIQEADPFGSALKYGATGASMGSQIQGANNPWGPKTVVNNNVEGASPMDFQQGMLSGTPKRNFWD